MNREKHHQDETKSYLISQSTFESNLEEFLRTLDERENDAELWVTQLHDEVVFELPFAEATNIPSRIVGKAACLEYIREWYNLFADFKFHDMKVHHLEEPGAYVPEYKIVFIREYWNPVRLLEAFGEGLNFKSELNFMDVKSIDPL